MIAIMAGRRMPVTVRWDQDFPFPENLLAGLCISFHGETNRHRVTQRSKARLLS